MNFSSIEKDSQHFFHDLESTGLITNDDDAEEEYHHMLTKGNPAVSTE